MPAKERGQVEVLTGESCKNMRGLLAEIARVYVVIFGNAAPLYEGGINGKGERIALREYLRQLCQVGWPGIEGEVVTTRDQLRLLQRLEKLPDEERRRLLTAMEQGSGYRMYYDTQSLLEQFGRDLEASRGSVPIVVAWGDGEYPVCGFATSLVARDEQALMRRIENMTYLTEGYGDVEAKIGLFLQSRKIEFPVMLDLEAGVIAERMGKANGSRWAEVYMGLRLAGIELGAKYGVTITYPESNYYLNGRRRGTFEAELDLVPDGGPILKLVLVNLAEAVSVLSR